MVEGQRSTVESQKSRKNQKQTTRNKELGTRNLVLNLWIWVNRGERGAWGGVLLLSGGVEEWRSGGNSRTSKAKSTSNSKTLDSGSGAGMTEP